MRCAGFVLNNGDMKKKTKTPDKLDYYTKKLMEATKGKPITAALVREHRQLIIKTHRLLMKNHFEGRYYVKDSLRVIAMQKKLLEIVGKKD